MAARCLTAEKQIRLAVPARFVLYERAGPGDTLSLPALDARVVHGELAPWRVVD